MSLFCDSSFFHCFPTVASCYDPIVPRYLSPVALHVLRTIEPRHGNIQSGCVAFSLQGHQEYVQILCFGTILFLGASLLCEGGNTYVTRYDRRDWYGLTRVNSPSGAQMRGSRESFLAFPVFHL